MQPRAQTDLGQLFRNQRVVSSQLGWTTESQATTLLSSMGCLASGLHYIHSPRGKEGLSLCHHDIKPENILIHHDKLIWTDFGASRFISPGSEPLELSRAFQSSSAMTPKYGAPELQPSSQVASSQIASPASDIWSFGCVLFETLFLPSMTNVDSKTFI